ncbi:protein C3orf33 homolog [Ostrea edulis]|uniref:protein C3orf33 homolog n=1 Tax=Ostrea edulis TaxID=37623 RepID=UPI0020956112|nr:protein C3orf33 homolog [Ostrea edulis]
MPGTEDDSSSSLFTAVTEFLDSNIRLTRNLLYGIGVVGFVVAVKNSGLTHLITCASDVPLNYIVRRVRVRSYVEAVGTRGVVHVQHRPFLNIIPNRWRPRSHVQLELALVDITPLGSKWLQDTILHRIVWFQPLALTDSTVHSNILFHKYFRRQSVNECLVQQGMCTVTVLTPEQLKTLSDPQQQMLKKLLSHQKTATEKEQGMWKIHKEKNEWTLPYRIKTIIFSPINFWRKIRRKFFK